MRGGREQVHEESALGQSHGRVWSAVHKCAAELKMWVTRVGSGCAGDRLELDPQELVAQLESKLATESAVVDMADGVRKRKQALLGGSDEGRVNRSVELE